MIWNKDGTLGNPNQTTQRKTTTKNWNSYWKCLKWNFWQWGSEAEYFTTKKICFSFWAQNKFLLGQKIKGFFFDFLWIFFFSILSILRWNNQTFFPFFFADPSISEIFPSKFASKKNFSWVLFWANLYIFLRKIDKFIISKIKIKKFLYLL